MPKNHYQDDLGPSRVLRQPRLIHSDLGPISLELSLRTELKVRIWAWQSQVQIRTFRRARTAHDTRTNGLKFMPEFSQTLRQICLQKKHEKSCKLPLPPGQLSLSQLLSKLEFNNGPEAFQF